MVNAAQVFIFDNREGELKLLIAKRSDIKKIAPNKWNIIGGKIEDNETNTAGAVREVEEEVSLQFSENSLHFIYHKVGSWEDNHEFMSFNFIAFISNTENSEIKLNIEHSEFKFVTLKESLKMNIVGYTIEEINLVFNYAAILSEELF